MIWAPERLIRQNVNFDILKKLMANTGTVSHESMQVIHTT